jgi:hypothetical protein
LVFGCCNISLCPTFFASVALRGALVFCRVEVLASVAFATFGSVSRSIGFSFGGFHAGSSRARPGNLASSGSLLLRQPVVRYTITPNNSFKPNLFRYGKSVARKACHAFSSTTQVGLIQALGGN